LSKQPQSRSVRAKIGEILYLMQIYEAQARSLNEQLNLINLKLEELKSAKAFLDSLKTIDVNTELLFPIGGGVFVKGRISNKEYVLMDIGANVIVKRAVSESTDAVNNNIINLEDAKTKIEGQLAQVIQKYNELQKLLERYSESMEEARK